MWGRDNTVERKEVKNSYGVECNECGAKTDGTRPCIKCIEKSIGDVNYKGLCPNCLREGNGGGDKRRYCLTCKEYPEGRVCRECTEKYWGRACKPCARKERPRMQFSFGPRGFVIPRPFSSASKSSKS